MTNATKHGIRWVIGKLHVSATDDAIRAEIRRRTAPRHGFKAPTQKQIAAMEAYAVKVHAENRALYAQVMGGR